MSDEENNKYEVERIIEARVEKKRRKLLLKFCVRWKGYEPEDDTWEPIESFDGSEEIVERFWERVNSGGRDFRDITKFKAGEIFVQTGPPRRKRKRQEQDSTPSATASPTKPEESRKTIRQKEYNDSDSDPDKRPKKRGRERVTSSRKFTPGIDDPVSMPNKNDRNRTNKTPQIAHKVIASPPARRRRVHRRLVTSPDPVSPSDQEDGDGAMFDVSLFGSPIEPEKELDDDSLNPSKNNTLAEKPVVPSPPPSSVPVIKRPLHRSAKPLIKLVDYPQLAAMEGALTVKARLMGRTTPTVNANGTSKQASGVQMQPIRQKPGPGRSSMGLKKNTSSLLTFEKGALKTVKGKYAKNEARRSESAISDDPPPEDSPSLNVEPPTASELLGLAGLDSQASEPLLSYENVASVDEQVISAENASELKAPHDNNTIHSDSLLPASSSIAIPQTGWRRSTIFDPLSRGPDPEDEKDPPSNVPGSVPFRLNLDHSFSITVHLSSASTPAMDSTTTLRTITRPGAFYKGNYALDICKAIHTVGSPGFVTTTYDAKDEDEKHFQRFCARLCDGELFIVPAGIEVLAFWSVENVTLSQRLNIYSIPDIPGKILFSKIIVDNYSEYSEIVTYADPIPWLQYMEKHQ